MLQKTLKNKISFSGFGLHNINKSELTLEPGYDGIRINGLEINPINVTSTDGMTTIKKYGMIEHLMSALLSLGIDNLNINLNGSNELPILDGCNRIYIDKILEVGLIDINKNKNIIKLNSEIKVEFNDSYIEFIPWDEDYMEFDCTVDFPYIGIQQYIWKSNNFDDYYENISNALTFFWDDQLNQVKSKGGANGVDDNNTIILNKNNFNQYNNADFARHKLLDLIGDLATINIIFPGKIIAYKPGHTINNLFIRKIQNKILENMKLEIPFTVLPKNKNIDVLSRKINHILIEQNYIDNNIVTQFEGKLKDYLNVKNVIAVNSGTSALMLSILSLEVDKKDIIIIPKLSFWATYQAVKIFGKNVILVDVDDNYQLDLNLVKEILYSHKVKVILTVHLYGLISNQYQKLVNLCNKHDIILIEDSSQAFGSKFKGCDILSKSYISCVSMYPTKIFGSCGNSGFIVTSDDKLAKKIKSYRDNGRKDTRYDHYFIGGNFVMDTMNAIYNLHKLDFIDEIIKCTSFKYQIYQDNLKNLKFFKIPDLKNQEPNGFNFTVKSLIPYKRDRIISFLRKKGINTSVIYPKSIDQQQGYIVNKYDKITNNKICQNIFSLPIFFDLSAFQQNYVIKNLIDIDNINTVVIGCGNMGLKHLNNLKGNKYFNVIGYIDKIKLDIDSKYLNSLDNNYTDFAVISTNTNNHFEWVIKCIENKINILIEKPAFIELDEFRMINNLIEESDLCIGVSMIERYNKFIKPINLANISKIDIIRVCNYSKNFDSKTILFDLLIHDLDILKYFHNLNFNNTKIVKIYRNNDIYKIKLKYNETIINIIVGNSNEISERSHIYYNENIEVEHYDFLNSYNKLKDLHNDYANYLLNKPNKICTIEESFEVSNFINKICSIQDQKLSLK